MFYSSRGGLPPYSAIHGGRSNRGSWRSGRSDNKVSNETTTPPRGALIESLIHEDLLSVPAFQVAKTSIQNCQYLVSFSWLKKKQPTIVTPDSSTYFRDINATHYPTHLIEPAFVVETVGDTLFLVRREKSLDEQIMDMYGYGHSFPEAYTELEECVKEADLHQRLIKYDFAGFQCIVRYEGDGYLPENIEAGLQTQDIGLLPHLEGLKLLRGGKSVPQEAMSDLKTSSAKKQLALEDVPNFILANHTSGVFHDVQLQGVRQSLLEWEEAHQGDIKVLSAALTKNVQFAHSRPGERFEVCSGAAGVLEIRQVGGQFPNALPEDPVRLWAGSKDEQDGSDVGSNGDSDVGVGSDTEGGVDFLSDEDEEQDFTACSEGCGYCGRCRYR
ncbi:uncharacterized protein LTR77_004031 [Saxophila tyrrhenica]|uniref:Uncharacterized protein n=1 Tax=Saxophila tyrrhenica TaxID=1690608 RepID=A0AAV9PEM4_9PEZI|nr:hypothetical protein LTR77_004031 [Saxophila tyrrhenica]